MKKSKTSLFEWVGDVILLLIMLIVILPLLWLFVSSFKSDADVIKWPPHFFPAEWVADQYRNSGTEDAAKYSDLCGQRDRHQSVL